MNQSPFLSLSAALQKDSDAEIWREMLPDNYTFSTAPVQLPQEPHSDAIVATAILRFNRELYLDRMPTRLFYSQGDTIELTNMATNSVHWEGRNTSTGKRGKINAFQVVLNDPDDYTRYSTTLKGKIVGGSLPKGFKIGDRVTVVDFKEFSFDNLLVRAHNERTGQVDHVNPYRVQWDD
jgi:hypothetical protein